MSMVYSYREGKHLDTDSMEAVELSNGDYVSASNDPLLLECYANGEISRDEMMVLGFTEDQLDSEDD